MISDEGVGGALDDDEDIDEGDEHEDVGEDHHPCDAAADGEAVPALAGVRLLLLVLPPLLKNRVQHLWTRLQEQNCSKKHTYIYLSLNTSVYIIFSCATYIFWI